MSGELIGCTFNCLRGETIISGILTAPYFHCMENRTIRLLDVPEWYCTWTENRELKGLLRHMDGLENTTWRQDSPRLSFLRLTMKWQENMFVPDTVVRKMGKRLVIWARSCSRSWKSLLKRFRHDCLFPSLIGTRQVRAVGLLDSPSTPPCVTSWDGELYSTSMLLL